MPVTKNKFKAAIQGGEAQVGLWISLCSGLAADVVADIGFDWLVLDMEHSPNDYATVLSQLIAIQQYGATPMVRMDWNDPVKIKRVLDLGAPGIILPMVNSAAEAAAAVSATRYPPTGIRGVSMSNRGNRYGRTPEYWQEGTDEICVVVQVETQEALAAVDEIAAVEGVDGVFFGPADIAASLGKLGKIHDDGVWDVIFDAAAKVHAVGKPTGTLIGDKNRVLQAFDKGFSFVACGSDLNLLARGGEAALDAVRAGLK